MKDMNDNAEVVDLFAPALRPAPLPGAGSALRERLLQRVAASQARHAGLHTVRGDATPWRTVKAGVRARTLWEGRDGASVLIALDAGASLPVHRHSYLEEGIVLTGSMQMGKLDLGPGDYHVSFPGSRHARITSREGCLTYLRGTSLGSTRGVVIELLGGLIPGDGAAPVTITGQDGEWRPLADGVEEKGLWHGPQSRSRFIRFAPGARLPAVDYPDYSEFMVTAGEVFFGDILVRSHEFHLAPAGSRHHEISSDCGGTVFVHQAAPAPRG